MTPKTYLIRDFPADLHRSAQILACQEQTTLKALILEGLALRLKTKPETQNDKA